MSENQNEEDKDEWQADNLVFKVIIIWSESYYFVHYQSSFIYFVLETYKNIHQ